MRNLLLFLLKISLNYIIHQFVSVSSLQKCSCNQTLKLMNCISSEIYKKIKQCLFLLQVNLYLMQFGQHFILCAVCSILISMYFPKYACFYRLILLFAFNILSMNISEQIYGPFLGFNQPADHKLYKHSVFVSVLKTTD